MNTVKVRQAKTLLETTIETYFSNGEPDNETWQCLRTYYGKICDLLEVTDRLLYEGLTTEQN